MTNVKDILIIGLAGYIAVKALGAKVEGALPSFPSISIAAPDITFPAITFPDIKFPEWPKAEDIYPKLPSIKEAITPVVPPVIKDPSSAWNWLTTITPFGPSLKFAKDFWWHPTEEKPLAPGSYGPIPEGNIDPYELYTRIKASAPEREAGLAQLREIYAAREALGIATGIPIGFTPTEPTGNGTGGGTGGTPTTAPGQPGTPGAAEYWLSL